MSTFTDKIRSKNENEMKVGQPNEEIPVSISRGHESEIDKCPLPVFLTNDNVLYHSQPGLALPQQVSESLAGDEDYSLKLMAAAKCAPMAFLDPGAFLVTYLVRLPTTVLLARNDSAAPYSFLSCVSR
jgi:hypothetical protein